MPGSSVANALRPFWLSGITQCKGARRVTTESFLLARTAHINSSPIDGKFTVFVQNQTKIPEWFSHEADRFSSAAFESLIAESTLPNFPRSIGWLLIRSYYSAFFALHSLMRLHGWACTRLTPLACRSLNKDVRIIFPEGSRIDSGLYLIKTSNRSSELSFEHMGTRFGGSHEALWGLLYDFLSELSSAVLAEAVDEVAAQDFVSTVTKFRDLLNKNGGYTWLTRVGNHVNYSHLYGAWHPYERSTCDVDRVVSIINRWRLEPKLVITAGTMDELLQFCEACAFIVSICRTTVEDLIFRSKPNSPFRLSSGRLLLTQYQS